MVYALDIRALTKIFNEKYAYMKNSLQSYVSDAFTFLSGLLLVIAEACYDALVIIFAGILHKCIFLEIIWPFCNDVLYKPFCKTIIFLNSIMTGICDFIFSATFSFLSLVVYILSYFLQAFVFLTNLIVLPAILPIVYFLDYLFFGGDFVLVKIFQFPSYFQDVLVPVGLNFLIMINNNFANFWQNTPLYFRSIIVIIFMPIFALHHTVKTDSCADYIKNTAMLSSPFLSFFIPLTAPVSSILLVLLKLFVVASWISGLYYAPNIIQYSWDEIAPVVKDNSSVHSGEFSGVGGMRPYGSSVDDAILYQPNP
jgi:hypothetical protein